MKLLRALAVTAIASSIARVSYADPVVVVVVQPRKNDPVASRMRDELTLIGARVTVVESSDATDPAALARKTSAAAVLVVESPLAIDVWVDPKRAAPGSEPSNVPERLVASASDPDDDAESTLALRAVESVRARLVDMKIAPPLAAPVEPMPAAPPPIDPTRARGPADRARVPSPSPSPAPAPQRGVALSLGGVFFPNPGSGLSSSAGVSFGLRWAALPPLSLDVVALAPLVAARDDTGEGAVRVHAGALGAGAYVDLNDPASAFGAGLGAGFAGALVAFSGDASSPSVRSASGSTLVALPYARLGFALRLVPRLHLDAGVLAAVARPRPVVRAAGAEIATWGEPLVALGLGVRYELP